MRIHTAYKSCCLCPVTYGKAVENGALWYIKNRPQLFIFPTNVLLTVIFVFHKSRGRFLCATRYLVDNTFTKKTYFLFINLN